MACHLSHVTKANSHSHRPSSANMHSRLIRKKKIKTVRKKRPIVSQYYRYALYTKSPVTGKRSFQEGTHDQRSLQLMDWIGLGASSVKSAILQVDKAVNRHPDNRWCCWLNAKCCLSYQIIKIFFLSFSLILIVLIMMENKQSFAIFFFMMKYKVNKIIGYNKNDLTNYPYYPFQLPHTEFY